jgi:hypothetical protein
MDIMRLPIKRALASTEEALQKIKRLVFANELPAAETLNQEEYDTLLDERDAAEFSTPWADAYEASEEPFKQVDADQDLKARLDKVREHVYKRVYNQTKVSDLASYTSDDIDLIVRYLLTSMSSNWINALWLSPSGPLNETAGELSHLILA